MHVTNSRVHANNNFIFSQAFKTLQIPDNKEVSWLRPDAKSQVTAEYKEGNLDRIDSVVISTQHGPDVDHKDIEEFVVENCVKKTPSNLLRNTKFLLIQRGVLSQVAHKEMQGLQVENYC